MVEVLFSSEVCIVKILLLSLVGYISFKITKGDCCISLFIIVRFYAKLITINMLT